MVALADNDIVRVVNKGDAPYTIMYDSKAYKLVPGEDAFIPFPAACVWFGDPRSTDNLGTIQNERGIRTYVPDRETEVRRLRAKYDNQFGDETTIIRHPQVEVYAVTGERIVTVLDDPAGESVNVATQTVTEQGNMLSLIQAQQAQIEKLTQLVMTTQTAGAPSEQPQPPTADDLAAALAGDTPSSEPIEPEASVDPASLPIEQLGGEAATDDSEPIQTDAQIDAPVEPPVVAASQELPPQSPA